MIGTMEHFDTAAELREEFDRTFVLSPSAQGGREVVSLLAIRVAGNACAVRLVEISGLVNNRKTVPFPSRIPEFLGVAGIRGELVPVYSLVALLGYGSNGDMPQWLVLCGSQAPVGLAFPEFESFLRIPPSDIHAAQQGEGVRDHVTEVVRAGAVVRAVVSIPSILQAIGGRIGRNGSLKE